MMNVSHRSLDLYLQGQTTGCVLVDLGKALTGALNGFNAYVTLSRSWGRSTIRLLREIDTKLFTEHPSEKLREEDVRLTRLETQTLEHYKIGERVLLTLKSSLSPLADHLPSP